MPTVSIPGIDGALIVRVLTCKMRIAEHAYIHFITRTVIPVSKGRGKGVKNGESYRAEGVELEARTPQKVGFQRPWKWASP